ncbi:MAG: histidine kinase [Sphingomonas sanxanigenens]|uniref:Histidine kinase n=1 Tax=Sphingomonas sanxanigenens TaxID=397260 RepID=A0A2W5A6M2_9SPHN|nr:MAG: histidine kinase [Sphingomonas sanxanigenens]
MRRETGRLRRETSAVALIEFGYSLPILIGVGMYGLEIANLAQTNLRISQIALALADNASRVGVTSTLNTQQIREADINDIFQGARLQDANLDLANRARITLSSLEVNKDGGQWIHWQRCLGMKKGAGYDSSYGKGGDGLAGNGVPGMGPTGGVVQAPPLSAVMFVEINYDYKPIIAEWLVGQPKIQYIASFVVRDKRDLDQATPYKATAAGGDAAGGVWNPSPKESAMTCDKYTT